MFRIKCLRCPDLRIGPQTYKEKPELEMNVAIWWRGNLKFGVIGACREGIAEKRSFTVGLSAVAFFKKRKRASTMPLYLTHKKITQRRRGGEKRGKNTKKKTGTTLWKSQFKS